MGGNGKADGGPGPIPARACSRLRRGARGPAARGNEPDPAAAADGPAAADRAAAAVRLHGTYYRPLARLAALLTGDMVIAEEVTCASLVAVCSARRNGRDEDAVLARLQRQVVIRSRRARRGIGRREPRAGVPVGPEGFAESPVVQALQGLRIGEREAVVLTLYLDLTDRQAAAAAGVSQAALRRNLADGVVAMRAPLPPLQ